MTLPAERPPRLAPVLLLSGGLSVTTLYIAIVYNRLPDLRHMENLAIPFANIAFTAYYLNRLVQLRNRFTSTSELQDGGQTWPTLPLLPGYLERSRFLTGAQLLSIFTWLNMSDLWSGKPSYELHWPIDDVDIVHRSIIILQGLFTIIVAIQARKVRQPEDRVLCEKKGHIWQCDRCYRYQTNGATNPTMGFPSYIARPNRTMIISALLCLMTIGLSHSNWNHAQLTEPGFIWLAIVLPLFTLAHHAFFLLHVKPSKKQLYQTLRPYSPLHMGKWKVVLYSSGTGLAWLGWLISALVVTDPSSRLSTYHWIVRSAIATLWVTEIVVLLLGFIEGVYMMVVERRAICSYKGHAWQCSRICKVRPDPDESLASKNKVSAFAPETP